MPGVGNSFVGCIGVSGALAPTADDITFRNSADTASGATVSRTFNAPAGMLAGDLMVACVSTGTLGGGDEYVVTAPAGWTALYEDPFGVGIATNLYSKIADASDEIEATSYTWEMTSLGGGQAGMRLIIVGWSSEFGRTIGNASVTHTRPNASIASPGGEWQLVFMSQRTASLFPQPEPDMSLTSTPANVLIVPAGNARSGASGVWASDNASPITGEFPRTDISFPRQGMVVAAVSL